MFEILFGWRKASKCKKLIKRVQYRIKLLKNKRDSIARQLRDDLAHLINIGHHQIAFNRVEELIKDENMISVYELLDKFCELILINLSYIRRHKDIPNDINEAISSLIFSSARFGDLPELKLIRKLFGDRYGQRFAMTAVDLCPGNFVNRQIKEKLAVKRVPDDEKRRLIGEIEWDCFQPEVLALEYCPEWHKNQMTENRRKTQTPHNEVGRYIEPVLIGNSYGGPQSSSKLLEFPMQLTISTVDDNTISAADSSSVSSVEVIPNFPEETIVYLDDIVELQSPAPKAGNLQDQSLFKFKSLAVSERDNMKNSFDQFDMDPHRYLDESEGVVSNGISSRNRSRRKLGLNEKQRMEKPNYSRNKDTRKILGEDRKISRSCSLEDPCYFLTCDEKNDCVHGKDLMVMDDEKTRNERLTPYLRAMTMPIDRSKDGKTPTILCSKSSIDKYPNHVHPKLPDYNDIQEKFMALKREHLQKSR